MGQARFFIYILASHSRVLYTGVTRDLLRRVHQHRRAQIRGFTRKYHVNRLVYFEETLSARAAFKRERQIKGWSREKKLRLVESCNAGWLDLAANWFPISLRIDPSLRSG
jgi:putative endonuclease